MLRNTLVADGPPHTFQKNVLVDDEVQLCMFGGISWRRILVEVVGDVMVIEVWWFGKFG